MTAGGGWWKREVGWFVGGGGVLRPSVINPSIVTPIFANNPRFVNNPRITMPTLKSSLSPRLDMAALRSNFGISGMSGIFGMSGILGMSGISTYGERDGKGTGARAAETEGRAS